jgi:hypothetical protein
LTASLLKFIIGGMVGHTDFMQYGGDIIMAVTSESDRGRRVKLWAAIVGGIVAILAVAMFFTQIVDVEDQIIEREDVTVIALYVDSLFIYLSAVFAVIGYIISWWYKLPAGILLVLAGSFFIVIDFLPDSLLAPSPVAASEVGAGAAEEPAFVFGIPALVAGVLFLWYWWLSRENARNTASP